MKNAIFYFTGTGNSLAVAGKIARQLGDTKLLSIRHDQQELDASTYERVGFVYPVYYYMMPVFVENFIKKLLLSKNQYLFGIATYGSTRGLALAGLRDLLEERGYKLKGEFSVIMPGNNIVGHGALPDKINNYILKRAEKTVHRISESIEQKNETEPVGPRAFERFYLSFESGRKNIHDSRMGFKSQDKHFNINQNCNGCRVCEKVCPVNNINMTAEGCPEWNNNCEQCMACIQWCSRRSINYMNRTQNRKSYHNREVSLEDLLKSEFIIE